MTKVSNLFIKPKTLSNTAYTLRANAFIGTKELASEKRVPSQEAETMNEFVQNRHLEFETPAEVIFDLVKQATGQEPVRRTKVVRG